MNVSCSINLCGKIAISHVKSEVKIPIVIGEEDKEPKMFWSWILKRIFEILETVGELRKSLLSMLPFESEYGYSAFYWTSSWKQPSHRAGLKHG